ncbi:DUF5134 domain-containing protein [Nocardia sp. NPDC050406]|uniref:DUF5134 domain-containing protein n=1 Tax=Nocardia sp. NPDC050406 TaxID=3364318 RepID=UPI0037AC7EFF
MTQFVEQHHALRWLAITAFILASTIVATRLAAHKPLRADQQSDAAHLMMCLVMLSMLVFPAGVDGRAITSVLTAMTTVYALLLIGRILQWRNPEHATVPGEGVTAFAYHVLAAAAMLYAMSGHTGDHSHSGGPATGPTLILAALFAIDAIAMALPPARRAVRHIFPHPVGGIGTVAVVPHVVMDLGTAYMLVAAVAG